MLAYFDCFAGISGDMTLGAMVDLGVPFEWLNKQLLKLPIDGFDLTQQRVSPNGIGATKVNVTIQDSHHHRHYHHIIEMIENSALSDGVKTTSLAIFEKIAVAEGTIHGVAKEKVHFHEVGSMDAIIDIVGTCLCIEHLNIDRVITGTLPLGQGTVTCQHGVLPIPAPATVEILKGAPVKQGSEMHELVTPTGAAIAMTLSDAFGPMPEMTISAVGYGAGSHVLETRPNLLRVFLGESPPSQAHDTQTLEMVSCCIDDMNPELFGYLMERLFEAGALDVYWVPVHMKKNRPGTMLEVLCEPVLRDAMVDIIFNESTTLGVRYHTVRRQALKRTQAQVDTPWGPVAVKRAVGPDGQLRFTPEFDACRAIAKAQGIALKRVYDAVQRAVLDKSNRKL